MKTFLPLAVLLALAASSCGKESAEIQGYDSAGSYVSIPALAKGHACPMIATPFSDQCFAGGFKVLFAERCQRLCTGKVAP